MAGYGTGQYGQRGGYDHGYQHGQGYDPRYSQQGSHGQYGSPAPYPGGYPPPTPPRKSPKVKYILAGIAALLVLGTCSAVIGSGAPDTTSAVSAQAAPSGTAAMSPPASTAVPPAAPPAVPSVEPSHADISAEVTVPNVVGMNLQSAQELLFPSLRTTSIDNTGQGRMQAIDSNWTVVRQDPPAGAVVLMLTDVKLHVVKIGE